MTGIFLAAAVVSSVASTSSVAGVTATTNKPPARITSDSTYYDRKEGLAIFKGNVHVDDADYQMHARRAYVFMDTASNTLSRIAAMGSVALTNGMRRAYGDKMTYQRDTGLIVLHGDEKDSRRPARVIEDSPDGPRMAEGKTIRFWINTEQVEIVGSYLTAPQKGGGGLPMAFPGLGGQ